MEKIPCRIYLESEDPDGLKGIDQDKMLKAQQMRYPLIKGYRDELENKYQWCIAAVPGPAWAKKVFPDLDEAAAVDALWEKIFAAVRVKGDGTAVEAWKQHAANLRRHMKILNDYNFKSLHCTNSLGIDLVVELAENHIWEAGFDAGIEYAISMDVGDVE